MYFKLWICYLNALIVHSIIFQGAFEGCVLEDYIVYQEDINILIAKMN